MALSPRVQVLYYPALPPILLKRCILFVVFLNFISYPSKSLRVQVWGNTLSFVHGHSLSKFVSSKFVNKTQVFVVYLFAMQLTQIVMLRAIILHYRYIQKTSTQDVCHYYSQRNTLSTFSRCSKSAFDNKWLEVEELQY